MKFSLRARFLLSYTIIIITSLIILNTYGVSLVYDKILSEAKDSLYNEANIIAENYIPGVSLPSSGNTLIALKHNFSLIQKITKARIIITEPDSRIIIDSDKDNNREGKFHTRP